MTHRGRVKNGVVVLDEPGALPEGAVVSVRPLKPRPTRKNRRKRPSTMYDRLKRYVGVVKDLPPDFSVNHDHYLYGTRKQE